MLPQMMLAHLALLPFFSFPIDDEWSNHPVWSGDWRVSESQTSRLGFSPRANTLPGQQFTISFLASKKAATGFLGEEKITRALEQIEKWKIPGKHRVLAAGKLWQGQEENGGVVCFVTSANGRTYLWIGDQQKRTVCAEVQSVRGSKPEQDQLFLDFGGLISPRFKYMKKDGLPRWPVIGYERPERDETGAAGSGRNQN